MNPFFTVFLSLAWVVFFVGKRAVVGPQKTFARFSVAMAVAGFGIQFATQNDDVASKVGFGCTLIGLLVALTLLGLDLVHIVRTHFKNDSL